MNDLLTAGWDEFVKSLETGEELRLESHVAGWVADAMAESLGSKIEALDVTSMDYAPNQ